MKFVLLSEEEYQKRFQHIQELYRFDSDNELKVQYSEEIVKKYGTLFFVHPPPDKRNKMKSGKCYPNAIKKMMDLGYQYVEGIITNKITGEKISHAWNIDLEGNHVDFTISDPNLYEYRGVIVPNDILYDVGMKNGFIWYCSLPYLTVEENCITAITE